MRDPVLLVENAVRDAARRAPRLVLAVSGGVDSMVLLDAAARVVPERVAAVATFDHGTGEAARRAVAHVSAYARAAGLPLERGRGGALPAREAAWREARWSFLHDIARRSGGSVVTAHTEDDQVETVLMRALRGAGARGLAGLRAPSPVLRPLLGLSRATIRDYAEARAVRWVEDPSNRDRRFLRNRVRHELLPALTAARPSLRRELLAIAERSAAWRASVERLAERISSLHADTGGAALHVAAADLTGYDSEALAVLWPALGARLGVALDRRGTRRVAEFTRCSAPGAAIQLAGGWEVVRRREWLELRRARAVEAVEPVTGAVGEVVRWGRWTLAPERPASVGAEWSATLPTGSRLTVRAWRPADRMTAPGGLRRRVKRFLSEAGISGAERAVWPVVLVGEDVVWIPGVRRSDAATERSGRPGLRYHALTK